LYLHQQGIDTTTPAGKAMFQMVGVFAEFERTLIRERVMAGLARAKAEGKQLGRRKVGPEIERSIRTVLKAGKGIVSTARRLGVGVSTVQRVKADLAAAA
jgi:DNA invertase Pin-like site-specific DNA recombinase